MPSRLTRYDIPGHVHFWTISCYHRLTFFVHDELKRVLVDGLRMLQNRFGVCLVGYVIMPEHVHVLLYPHRRGMAEAVPISQLLHAFKKHVGFHGKQCLAGLRERHGRLWTEALDEWATSSVERTLWTTRGYDFNIDRFETLCEKLDYCHKNPMTRGLVQRAEDWSWSSYRFYEFGDRSILALDWDRAWPIKW
jgi:putative transposase